MKCNRCGKEIDELEVFCDECKKELKKVSSKSDVNELEELIENQKRLSELENTKELDNLDNLVNEELEKEIIESREEKYKDISRESEKKIEETKNEELIEEDPELFLEDKSKKKKLIIIISIISAILIIGLIILFIFLGKEKPEEKEEVLIDYEKVINTYGDYITDIVKEYMKTNDDIPTWQYVTQKLEYDRYEVECVNHLIYSDGSIYLSECKVDNKKTKYTYGIELDETKVGKKIDVYKEQYDGYVGYSSKQDKYSTLVGTVTCKTEDCTYISAYDKYVLIKEDDEYYLYDYTNNSLNFGPFLLNNEYDYLVYENTLYGLIYKSENKNNIYNVQTGKIIENIKGSYLSAGVSFDPTIMYKYNYVILASKGKYDFVNLKTGNISYTIQENIGQIIESKNKKIVYITAYTKDPNKFKIYNSNGKLLFGGNEYSKLIFKSNNILLADDTNFYTYDSNLKLKTSSKTYDKLLGLYEDFAVAIKNSNLMILNIEDKVLTTFENVYDIDNYVFHSNLSGKTTIDNKEAISLMVENKKMPSGTKGRFIEYYYILSTGDSGFNELSSI